MGPASIPHLRELCRNVINPRTEAVQILLWIAPRRRMRRMEGQHLVDLPAYRGPSLRGCAVLLDLLTETEPCLQAREDSCNHGSQHRCSDTYASLPICCMGSPLGERGFADPAVSWAPFKTGAHFLVVLKAGLQGSCTSPPGELYQVGLVQLPHCAVSGPACRLRCRPTALAAPNRLLRKLLAAEGLPRAARRQARNPPGLPPLGHARPPRQTRRHLGAASHRARYAGAADPDRTPAPMVHQIGVQTQGLPMVCCLSTTQINRTASLGAPRRRSLGGAATRR